MRIKTRKKKRAIKYLMKHEEDSFINYIKTYFNPPEIFYYIFLLETGVRCTEAINLNFEDVYKKKSIYVKTLKGGPDRRIPITANLRHELEIYTRWRGDHKGPLFIQGKTFEPYTSAIALRKRFKFAMRDIGKEDLSLHSLRHTFGKKLVKKPFVKFPTIKYLMGHSSISSTVIYAEADEEDAFEAMEVPVE